MVYATAYRPQSQGMVERFHQTLKIMMRSYCLQYSKDWDEGIPLLLFALRESEQDNLKFSPFELIYGHQIRGPVQVLKEAWTGEETPTFRSSPTLMKERLSPARELAAENLRQAQSKMKEEYDRRTILRSFEPKDQVLVQRFHQGHALQPKFEGPLEIVKRLSDVNYLVRTPKKRNSQRTYHVNQLKTYSGIVSPVSTVVEVLAHKELPFNYYNYTIKSTEIGSLAKFTEK
nr:uncharacterized protein LOC128704760 [Cherax quadricarinatus]